MSNWATLRESIKSRAKASNLVYKMLLVLGMIAVGLLPASATVNLSDIWDFITEITDNQSTIIALVVFIVIIGVVKKFGKGLGDILNIKTFK